MTIVTSIQDMYSFTGECFFDIISDEISEPTNCSYSLTMLQDIQEALLKRDRKGIAQALKDGFTVMMVPNFDEDVDELRITDNGKCIMVFMRGEMNW